MTLPGPLVLLDAARSLEAGQVLSRVARRARFRCVYPWAAGLLFPEPDPYPQDPAAAAGIPAPGPGSASEAVLREATSAAENRFAFLNLPGLDMGSPVDWKRSPDGDRLWGYNLHYGEWALSLAITFRSTGKSSFRDSLLRLMEDWIANNPPASEPGWEPYPLARRIAAWCKAWLCLREDPAFKSFWTARLAPSLCRQASFLARNLERDLANNHLIADFKALAWAGLCVAGHPAACAWLAEGSAGLWSELRRQVLPDGVHDERSLSYHCIVLQDALEAAEACLSAGRGVPEDVLPCLGRMCRFLACAGEPGCWPMVNDSTPGYPCEPAEVLAAAGRSLRIERPGLEPATIFSQAGYAVLRDGRHGRLFFDAGPMGPARNSGHGHADCLSFTLCAGDRPVIVDPGVATYRPGPVRDAFRATEAHNTVALDGHDQCVFWGNFRAALTPNAGITGSGETWVEGEHDGYRRLSRPVLHRRRVSLPARGIWSVEDWFQGSGVHDFTWTIQFAPGAEARLSGTACEVRWPSGAGLRLRLDDEPPGPAAALDSGRVALGWNREAEAPRYRLRWRCGAPCRVRAVIEVRV